MEASATDVRLRIKQIRNANLSWVRGDPGPHDDDELLKSLDDHGMMLPILLTNELVVADGARRLLRAERLGWKDVPVIVTTDWNVVRDYYATARRLEAEGLPHEPMTWAQITDLVLGPLDQLYRRRRLERGRETRAATIAAKAAGLPPPSRTQTTEDVNYTSDAAEVLGWQRSDLRCVREIYWTLAKMEAQEAEQRKTAYQQGGAEAADKIPHLVDQLRKEAVQLETNKGFEGGLYSLHNKVKLISKGKDPATIKVGRAKRRFGEPTLTQRKAAAAADPTATGREMDAQTLTRLTQVLTDLGVEVDEYTHMRHTVRFEDATTAARNIKVAVNQFNRLTRMVRNYAESLEEST